MIKLFKQKLIKIPVPNKRVDERDTMFARMARKPNNSAYKDYYSNHPGLIKKDDYIRSLPALLDTQGKYYTKKFSLLRWCNAWMFRALAAYVSAVSKRDKEKTAH